MILIFSRRAVEQDLLHDSACSNLLTLIRTSTSCSLLSNSYEANQHAAKKALQCCIGLLFTFKQHLRYDSPRNNLAAQLPNAASVSLFSHRFDFSTAFGVDSVHGTFRRYPPITAQHLIASVHSQGYKSEETASACLEEWRYAWRVSYV